MQGYRTKPSRLLGAVFFISAVLFLSPSGAFSAETEETVESDREVSFGPTVEEVVPWKFRMEISYVSTSGNTDTQSLAVKTDARKEGEVNRYFFKGSYLQTQDMSEETSNKLALDASWERVMNKRLFGLFALGYRRDKFSGYDFRAFGGPGMGYDFVKTARHKLKGVFTLLYYHDEFSKGAESTDDYIAGKVTAAYEWKILKNVKLAETIDFFTSLEDTERLFVDSVTAAEVKVNDHVSVGINYVVNYQNVLPSPELRHTDKTFLTTLIIDY